MGLASDAGENMRRTAGRITKVFVLSAAAVASLTAAPPAEAAEGPKICQAELGFRACASTDEGLTQCPVIGLEVAGHAVDRCTRYDQSNCTFFVHGLRRFLVAYDCQPEK